MLPQASTVVVQLFTVTSVITAFSQELLHQRFIIGVAKVMT